MPDRHVFLQPARLHFSEEPSLVVTVLGSCVALTLWDPITRLAVVSHCIYPSAEGVSGGGGPGRFVDRCVPHMVSWFESRGVPATRLQAKLFGGASGNYCNHPSSRMKPVGRQNVEAALAAVEKAGLTLQARDVGGTDGRKLRFLTLTGEAWIKRLRAIGGGLT